MRLHQLAADEARLIGDDALTVAGLTADSRAVLPGYVFAALTGAHADGFDFIDGAIARGAIAVLGDGRLAGVDLPVTVLVSDDPRRALARMAARLHSPQPRHVVAITGTNGKTSTASFTAQLWRAVGLRAASLGTLGLDAPGFPAGESLTTPDPLRLHETLSALVPAGIDHVAMEASSHGLDQRRLDGVTLGAGAFLNLSRDHLDYHGTEEAYLRAKWRLFDTLLPTGATAVLNADLPGFAGLADEARDRGLNVVDVGRRAARLRLVERKASAVGQHLVLDLDGSTHEVSVPIVGAFQAENLLAALALAETTGIERSALLDALSTLQAPRGRMELVARHPSGGAVFVDYAHTPDALAKALDTLRDHTPGRLVVVFGCGGDRDPGKRPEMGAAAADRADRVIVTDDNPRNEDAAVIRAAIMRAVPRAAEIGDRALAIAEGLADLGPDDVLLVAGKGHEQGQIVGDRVLPFDDANVVRMALWAPGAAA